MLKRPSRRGGLKGVERLNLIPILDAIFIFIFFLLMSSSYVKIFEIGSNVPIISTNKPPKLKKPLLSLSIKIFRNKITLYRGASERFIQSFKKTDGKNYDLELLRQKLLSLKEKYPNERTIMFESKINLDYGELVKIMDALRLINKTDPPIYKKTKDGMDAKVNVLFDDIIFGDIQS